MTSPTHARRQRQPDLQVRQRRTERVIYAITEHGRQELAAWLDTASPPSTGYRDDLYLKLTAAARKGETMLTSVVRREREALFGELHSLRQLAADEQDPLVALLIDGATLQVQARIELLDRADQRADQLTRSQLTQARSQRPPRGRHKAA